MKIEVTPTPSRRPLWRLTVLAITGSVLIVFSIAPALDASVRNVALIALRNNAGAQSVDRGVRRYPLLDTRPGNVGMEVAKQWFTNVGYFEFAGAESSWALGRIQLATGDMDSAADTLHTLREAAARDPLLYADVLVSLAYGGRPSEAIQLYTSALVPNTPTRQVQEAVAYAFLLGGDGADPLTGASAKAAIQVRPEDLLANYLIWQAARQAGDGKTAEQYRSRLYSLAALPDGPFMWEKTLPAIVDLIQQGVWDQAKTNAVLAYLAWRYPDKEMAVKVLTTLAVNLPEVPIGNLYLGDIHLRLGNITSAIIAYERALMPDQSSTAPMLRLAAALELRAQETPTDPMADLGQAADWYVSVLALQPDDLLALGRLAAICLTLVNTDDFGPCNAGFPAQTFPQLTSSLSDLWLDTLEDHQPNIELNQPWQDGWILEGVTVDEAALVRGESTDFLVFWIGPEGAVAGKHEQGWYRVGNRWIQFITSVGSLLPNGGFELGVMKTGLPIGITSDIYDAPQETKRLERDPDLNSTVAVLRNTETYSLTSLASEFIPVVPASLYLQSGWLRSDGAYGYWGRAWFMNFERRFNRTEDYVKIGITDDQWQRYVGLAQPPKNAVEFQTWLLNHYSAGPLYQDNAWLVPIGMPGRNCG